jgi:hypothetical protein
MKSVVRLAIVFLLCALASCGSTATAPRACTPGESVACVGPGGCSTNHVCNAQGTGFGACLCGGSADAGLQGADSSSAVEIGAACAYDQDCTSFTQGDETAYCNGSLVCTRPCTSNADCGCAAGTDSSDLALGKCKVASSRLIGLNPGPRAVLPARERG